MFSSAVVANFKAFNPNVTLVVNRQYRASTIGSKTLASRTALSPG